MRHPIQKLLTARTIAFLTAAAIVPVALTAQASPSLDVSGVLMSSMLTSLGDRLSAVADYWADPSDRIDFTVTDTGETKYVATRTSFSGYAIYYNGQNLPNGSIMGACGMGRTGAPVNCDAAYGESLLFALEDLVDEEADPTELTIKCHILFGSTGQCKVTWLDGSASCYTCSGGSCTKSPC